MFVSVPVFAYYEYIVVHFFLVMYKFHWNLWSDMFVWYFYVIFVLCYTNTTIKNSSEKKKKKERKKERQKKVD